MSSAAETALRQELAADEQLIWAGQPQRWVRLQFGDLLVMAFALGTVWLGVGMMTMSSGPANLPIGVIGLLPGMFTVSLALRLRLYRFGVDALRLRRTCYGVTDRRIIIRTGLLGRKVKSVRLQTMKQITMSDNGSGIGTIIFGPAPPWYAHWGLRGWWRALDAAGVASFQLIDRVGEVYNIIFQAQRSATSL